MSTFKGIVTEFPSIRVDYFRFQPDTPSPLALFLSHVHSDHLQGLESLKSPFVYCSQATKQILLRLEKYPHRMNFARGILESRIQTYRHLKNILKPIPLDTPTVIELSPGHEIRVTLIDANHCIGAVMFLIEGQGHAILYTGDIRSEQWWINSIVRQPALIPFASGLKQLDRMYLDTTFATKSDPHRKFPSKLQGAQDLLEKVTRYPDDTIFYLEAWTFGYEDVWIALSNLLNSSVHLDKYRWSLYRSLGSTQDALPCHEASALCGYKFGNHTRGGCLTSNPNVRLHSCERGNFCTTMEQAKNVVRLVPIISRLPDGTEMHEMGLGGGQGDLDQIHELEVGDTGVLAKLLQLCATRIEHREDLVNVTSLLSSTFDLGKNAMRLGLDISSQDAQSDITIDELMALLTKLAHEQDSRQTRKATNTGDSTELSRTITFAYSRHSSYSELCALVDAFKPKDVYPCTVDESTWTPALSMKTLFGAYCSGNIFAHDAEMMTVYQKRVARGPYTARQQRFPTREETSQHDDNATGPASESPTDGEYHTPRSSPIQTTLPAPSTPQKRPRDSSPPRDYHSPRLKKLVKRPAAPALPSIGLPLRRSIRGWAYEAASGESGACESWHEFGGLACVKSGRSEGVLGDGVEEELSG